MKSLRTACFLCFILTCFQIDLVAQNGKGNILNVLIIIADDCTYCDLPVYGGSNVKTPRIDKLASEGMTFNKAYVTMSMCVPCRTELYTGMQPAGNGVCWNHAIARSGLKSIVHYLGKHGYRTGIAGKIHVNPEDVFPFDRVEGLEHNCVAETADFTIEGMKEFILKDREQPFCLIAALVVPHIPWTVGDPSHFDSAKLELPPYLADTKKTREEFAKYLAEIEVLDHQVGRTLDLLKETGVNENTIVIFTSEQGAQLPFCKWTNWENGVHTGFIVKWLGKVKKGSRTDAIIQYADVLPTLIDALGGEKDMNFDGRSFLPVLLGKKEKHREFAYFMHNNIPEGPPYPIRSITDGEHHYIRNLTPERLYIEKHLMARMPLNKYWPSWVFESTENPKILDLVTRYQKRPFEELYKTSADPFEMKNLAGNYDFQDIKNKLSTKLDKWMKQQGDPGAELDNWDELENAWSGNHFKLEK